jgi:hypothetical protein
MSVQKLGATGVVAKYTIRKYCPHHAIQQKDLKIAETEWNQKAKSMDTASLR